MAGTSCLFSRHFFIFILLTSISAPAFSQKENYVWYFGNLAGLDFSTNPPAALTNGMLNTSEGCASIADSAGALLFYTDGITVWNKQHVVMDNGSGLHGDGSSTQSGMIVPQPGSSNKFLIFTLDDMGGVNGLKYSEVDLSLSLGNGSVTVKNVPLHTPSTEKITAARHCNRTDVWVISHDWGTDTFRTFLVTASGLSMTPVVSASGAAMAGSTQRTIGQMKISPAGNMIGLVVYDPGQPGSVELYDFDPSAGIVSNPLLLSTMTNAYGCEFSPDGSKFYAGSFVGSMIVQWNLCAPTDSAVVASAYTISTAPSVYLGGFQRAPDSRIYVSPYSLKSLSVIKNPDLVGASCNYQDTVVSIFPNFARTGLPNFLNEVYSYKSPAFTYTMACMNGSFTAPGSGSLSNACSRGSFAVVSRVWDFGDTASGASNTSSLYNPQHTFSGPGNYMVSLVTNYACSSDTTTITVNIAGGQINIAGPAQICKGETHTLTASGGTAFSWSSGQKTPGITITPATNTVYTVTVIDEGGCVVSKTHSVTVQPCLSIEDQQGGTKLLFYPNPAGSVLNIKTTERTRVFITNNLGNLLLEVEAKPGTTEVDLRTLPDGIYTLRTPDSRGRSFSLIKTD